MSSSVQTPYAGLTASGVVVVKTSSFITLSGGNPQDLIAGQYGSASVPPDIAWDYTTQTLWVCTGGDGTIPGTQWTQVQFYGATDFDSLALSGSITVAENAFVGGTLGVGGATNIAGTLSVEGEAGFGSAVISNANINAGTYIAAAQGYYGKVDGVAVLGGMIGELLEASTPFGTGPYATTNVALNVTTLTVSAGDWDVWGNVYFDVLTAAQQVVWWISNLSADNTGATAVSYYRNIDSPVNGNMGGPVGPWPLRVASETIVYLSATVSFAAGTVRMSGNLRARRRA